jgi:molybdopterin molybdotransferase
LISIKKATEIVLTNKVDLPTEKVNLAEAIGRQLREDLFADRDFPPFDRVAMDGIAVRFSDFENGQRIFEIVDIQAAGSPQKICAKSGVCMEVMTGAILPKGLDTVIRYEDVLIENSVATITIEVIKNGQNIHRKGTDRKAKDLLITKGQLISAAEIGVAATIGKATLEVTKLPKIAIISTGDELVKVSEIPALHQIRTSNVLTVQALLKQYGIAARLYHINDNEAETTLKLGELLKENDVLILSGGVSKGKFDYVPKALETLKVEKLFHKVKQRPGKPFWFGKTENNKTVFALPGNPVSTFMCANRYFLPWLRTSMNLSPFENKFAVLDTDFSFKPSLQYFLQVKISYAENGQILAKPISGKGSGDLANLADADGFLELPADKTDFKKGQVYRLIAYR